MKFTSEDLMKSMGLAVGNKVKVKTYDNFEETFETYEVMQKAGDTYLQSIDCGFIDSFAYLIDQDFEILPRPKRVGDLKCDGKCPLCPCIYVCNEEVNAVDKTLYEVLEKGIATYTKIPKKLNGDIYNVIKARLDKEVLKEYETNNN